MNKEIRKQVKALEKLRLPELRARFAEVLGEETRAPNRAYLIRRITEALEARAEAAAHPDEVVVTSRAEVPAAAAPGDDSAPAAQPGEKLSQLPIADLQARYLETVGRPTSSDDRRYVELADM